MEDELRVGIVGLGNWGRKIADIISRRNSKIKIENCFTRTKWKREKFAEDYKCKKSETYEELLADKNVDAVIITTANYVHFEDVVKAARAKKHIFVDKPISNNIEEAVKMIQECYENEVILEVGHNTRYYRYFRKMKEIIEKGEIGEVMMFEANVSHSGGKFLKPTDWRWDRKKCPAAPLLQNGIHFIDVVHYLLGETDEVYAILNRKYIKAEIDDVSQVLLKLKNGVSGYIGSNYVSPWTFIFNIYGTEKNLFLDNREGLVMYDDEKGKHLLINYNIDVEETIVAEFEDFYTSIKENRKPEVGGWEALIALAVVEASRISSEYNKKVNIKDVLEEDIVYKIQRESKKKLESLGKAV